MRFKNLLAAIAVMTGIFACTCVANAQTAVNVTVPEFNVVVNERFVENDYREYPFIVYNDVTYFPMTYNDCAFLGVTNNWVPGKGNIITTTSESSGYFDDTITPYFNDASDEYAYITDNLYIVNDIYVYNANMKVYPILQFRDIPYFPLTWDWCQDFGWTINFDSNYGLVVASHGYRSDGTVKYFHNNRETYGGYVKYCHISELEDNYPDYSGLYSYSPNHYRNKPFYEDDYVEMCSLGDINYLSVHRDEVYNYRSKGWYTLNEIDKMFDDAFRVNSIIRLENHIEDHVLETRPYSTDGKDLIEEYLPTIRNNYISVFNYNLTAEMTIRKSEIGSYQSVGWLTYDQFVINLANSFASQGQYAKAVTALSFGENNYFPILDHSYTIPFEIHDPHYASTYASAKRIYADTVLSYGCPISIVNTRVAKNEYGTLKANLVIANVSYKEISSVRLHFTCYDANGIPTDDYKYSDRTVITVDDDVDLASLEANIFTTSLYSNSNTAYIGNIVVESVTFADGTTWSR